MSSSSSVTTGGATKLHHTATSVEEIGSHVTITDPTHPLCGSRLPVVRRTTTWRKHHLVVRLPNGRTRAISLAAIEPHSPLAADTPVLLPISARTLLPVTRRLRLMARTQEEADHVVSSCFTASRASAAPQPSDPLSSAPLKRTRSASTPAVCPTARGSDRSHPPGHQGGQS